KLGFRKTLIMTSGLRGTDIVHKIAESMWAFYGKLHEPKELVIIDSAGHLFEGQAAEVGEALEDLLQDFTG
ncbi:MAG: hypothetical protein ABJC89_17985, partial [Acidobacteriota bacterium]